MVADMKLMSTRHGYTHAAITVPHTTDIAEILLKLALNTNQSINMLCTKMC